MFLSFHGSPLYIFYNYYSVSDCDWYQSHLDVSLHFLALSQRLGIPFISHLSFISWQYIFFLLKRVSDLFLSPNHREFCVSYLPVLLLFYSMWFFKPALPFNLSQESDWHQVSKCFQDSSQLSWLSRWFWFFCFCWFPMSPVFFLSLWRLFWVHLLYFSALWQDLSIC